MYGGLLGGWRETCWCYGVLYHGSVRAVYVNTVVYRQRRAAEGRGGPSVEETIISSHMKQ